jgi:hypothetical protein
MGQGPRQGMGQGPRQGMGPGMGKGMPPAKFAAGGGVKIRGTGAAQRGVKARGGMA